MNTTKIIVILCLFETLVLTGCLDTESLVQSTTASDTFSGCIGGEGLTNNSVQVQFGFPSDADKVVVYRDGIEVANSATSLVTRITDKGLTEGETYTYTCDAYVGGRKIVGANSIQLSPVNTNAPTFTGIISATASGSSSAVVTWNPESQSGAMASYYQIFVTVGSTQQWNVAPRQVVQAGGVFKATITGLGDELPYAFGVRACTNGNICDNNTATIVATTTDGGAPKTVGISSVSTGNHSIYITAPWNDTNGRISLRQIFVCTGANCSFGTSPYSTVPVTDSQAANPPTQLTVLNVSEQTTYRLKVVDIDPSGNSNDSTTQVTQLMTGDLTPPAFGGITTAVRGTPADKQAILYFTSIDREGTTDAGASTGTTNYILYMNSATYPTTPADACANTTAYATFSAAPYPPGVITSTYTVNNLHERTNYSFCLRAQDAAGNISTNIGSSQVLTSDITAPVFYGIQHLVFTPATRTLDLDWVASTSTDLETPAYVVTIWKNSATPVSPTQISTSNTSLSINTGQFAFTDYDVVYAMVDACDNSASLHINGQGDNCTTTNVKLNVSIPNITPPQNFLGITSATSTIEGQADLSWGTPTSGWTNFAGLNIYSVTNSGNTLTSLKSVTCSSGSCPTSTTVIGLNPSRTYTFYVTAYSPNNIETTYLSTGTNVRAVKIKDSTAPNLTLSSFVYSSPTFTWDAATDNQYAGESNAIYYALYRRDNADFSRSGGLITSATILSDIAAGNVKICTSTGCAAAPSTQPTTAPFGGMTTTSYQESISSLVSGHTYYYALCAFDQQGNESCKNNTNSILTGDVIPPTLSAITSTKYPQTDQSNNAKKWSLTFTAQDNYVPVAQGGTTYDQIQVRVYQKISSVKNSSINKSTDIAANGAGLNGVTKICDAAIGNISSCTVGTGLTVNVVNFAGDGSTTNSGATVTIGGLAGDSNVNEYISYFVWIKDLAGNIATSGDINMDASAITDVYSRNKVSLSSTVPIIPTTGLIGGGTTVVIRGSGFSRGTSNSILEANGYGSDTTVTIGGTACTSVIVYSSDFLACVTPAGGTPGTPVDVVVTNPDGSSATASAAYTFLSTLPGTNPCNNDKTTWPTSGPALGYAGGAGTSASPFIICNKDHLKKAQGSSTTTNYYRFGKNIDLGATDSTANTPAPSANDGFSVTGGNMYGNWDGQNYSILNSTINITAGSGTANWVTTYNGAVIHDLNILGMAVTQTSSTTGTGNSIFGNWGNTAGTSVAVNFTNLNIVATFSNVVTGAAAQSWSLINYVPAGGTISNCIIRFASNLTTSTTQTSNLSLLGGGSYIDITKTISIQDSTISLNNTSNSSNAVVRGIMGGSGAVGTGRTVPAVAVSRVNLHITSLNNKSTAITQSKPTGYAISVDQTKVVMNSGGGWWLNSGANTFEFVSITDSYMTSNELSSATPTVIDKGSTPTDGTSSFFMKNFWAVVNYPGMNGVSIHTTSTSLTTNTFAATNYAAGTQSGGLFYNSSTLNANAPVTVGTLPFSAATTSQMQDQANNMYATAGYDFSSIWKWCSAYDYPHLQWETCP